MFARRVGQMVVERGVIEHVEDLAMYDAPDRVEVLDHSGRRAFGPKRPAQGHFEPVRMPVQTRALSQVIRENVRRLEPEMLTNLHNTRRFEVRPQ